MEAAIIGSDGSDDGIPRPDDGKHACRLCSSVPSVSYPLSVEDELTQPIKSIRPLCGSWDLVAASASYSRTKIWDVIFHWPSGWCSHNLTVLPEIGVVSPPFTNKAVKWEVT